MITRERARFIQNWGCDGDGIDRSKQAAHCILRITRHIVSAEDVILHFCTDKRVALWRVQSRGRFFPVLPHSLSDQAM